MITRFYVKDTDTGFMVESFDTYKDALDKINECLEENAKHDDNRFYRYKIVDEDGVSVFRYTFKVQYGDNWMDFDNVTVYEHPGYTAVDLIRDYCLKNYKAVELINEHRTEWGIN